MSMDNPNSLIPPVGEERKEEMEEIERRDKKEDSNDPISVLTEIKTLLERFFKEREEMAEEMKSIKNRLTKIEKATISLIESYSNKDDLSGTDPEKARGEGAEELKIKEEKGPAGTKDSDMVVKTAETNYKGKRAVVVNNSINSASNDLIFRALRGELTVEHLAEIEKKARAGMNI